MGKQSAGLPVLYIAKAAKKSADRQSRARREGQQSLLSVGATLSGARRGRARRVRASRAVPRDAPLGPVTSHPRTNPRLRPRGRHVPFREHPPCRRGLACSPARPAKRSVSPPRATSSRPRSLDSPQKPRAREVHRMVAVALAAELGRAPPRDARPRLFRRDRDRDHHRPSPPVEAASFARPGRRPRPLLHPPHRPR